MTETTQNATPEQALVNVAKIWREKDRHYATLKRNAQCPMEVRDAAQRTEYWARNKLRAAIDEVAP